MSEFYGYYIGYWDCLWCEYRVFPSQLQAANKKAPFVCPKCNRKLAYNTEEEQTLSGTRQLLNNNPRN